MYNGSMSTGSIQLLDAGECRELLRVGSVARIAFQRDGRLELLPVNYVYDTDIIVVRTNEDSPVVSIVDRDFVLEADHHDDTYQVGWSVLVRGTASRMSDEELAEYEGRVPRSWAGGDDPVHLAIVPHELTGRRARAFPR